MYIEWNQQLLRRFQHNKVNYITTNLHGLSLGINGLLEDNFNKFQHLKVRDIWKKQRLNSDGQSNPTRGQMTRFDFSIIYEWRCYNIQTKPYRNRRSVNGKQIKQHKWNQAPVAWSKQLFDIFIYFFFTHFNSMNPSQANSAWPKIKNMQTDIITSKIS